MAFSPREKETAASDQKWCVQKASSRITGIGTPMAKSRMERMMTSSLQSH
jgi:hypothetical protein